MYTTAQSMGRVVTSLGAGRVMAPPPPGEASRCRGAVDFRTERSRGQFARAGEGIEGALRIRLGRLRVVRAQRHPAHRPAAPPSPRGAARVGGGESASDTGVSVARQVRRRVGAGCQRSASPQPSGPALGARDLSAL